MTSLIFIGLSLLQATSAFLIDSCDGMKEAVDLAQSGYVNASMHPFADIQCDNFTTLVLDKYDMDIFSSENLENFYGNVNVKNVRFEVTNGANLDWETNVEFEGDEFYNNLPDVNGGALYIGQGSRVRFFNNFETTNIGVRSETAESSDFPDHQNSGGCVWNNGYFRVDGDAHMTGCESSGGGEGSPGPGGAIFNNVNGSILFSKGVEIYDVSITDDEGNSGAGIYNLGKVNIRGNSVFEDLRAEEAGAIYNGEGAIFNFKDGSNVLFNKCRAFDGVAGAIVNHGVFKFSGPAVFIESSSDYRASSIYVGNTGVMTLKKDSYFMNSVCSDPKCSPVYVAVNGTLNYKEKSTTFTSSSSRYGEALCEGVYFEDGEVCSD